MSWSPIATPRFGCSQSLGPAVLDFAAAEEPEILMDGSCLGKADSEECLWGQPEILMNGSCLGRADSDEEKDNVTIVEQEMWKEMGKEKKKATNVEQEIEKEREKEKENDNAKESTDLYQNR